MILFILDLFLSFRNARKVGVIIAVPPGEALSLRGSTV